MRVDGLPIGQSRIPEEPDGCLGKTKGLAVTATNGAALETALAWFHARTGHDLDKTMSVVADDIVCDAPGVHVEGSEGFREFEGSFLPMISGATLIAGFGDDDSALLMYDL